MRIFKLKRLVSLTLVAVSCGGAVPVVAFADDDGKGDANTNAGLCARCQARIGITGIFGALQRVCRGRRCGRRVRGR